jgi:hypothetical protein
MDRLRLRPAAYVRVPLLFRAPLSECFRPVAHVSRSFLIVLASTMLLGGCNMANTVPEAASVPAVVAHTTNRAVLRVRPDAVRNRIWMLSLDHLGVYDGGTRRLIRRIELPSWSVADAVCPPDLVVDGEGTVFISHNIEPKLWQIDPDNFELKEHTLRLIGREQLDIGFGSLAVAKTGVLMGGPSTGGSVWRIDLEAATAREVEHTRVEGCLWH